MSASPSSRSPPRRHGAPAPRGGRTVKGADRPYRRRRRAMQRRRGGGWHPGTRGAGVGVQGRRRCRPRAVLGRVGRQHDARSAVLGGRDVPQAGVPHRDAGDAGRALRVGDVDGQPVLVDLLEGERHGDDAGRRTRGWPPGWRRPAGRGRRRWSPRSPGPLVRQRPCRIGTSSRGQRAHVPRLVVAARRGGRGPGAAGREHGDDQRVRLTQHVQQSGLRGAQRGAVHRERTPSGGPRWPRTTPRRSRCSPRRGAPGSTAPRRPDLPRPSPAGRSRTPQPGVATGGGESVPGEQHRVATGTRAARRGWPGRRGRGTRAPRRTPRPARWTAPSARRPGPAHRRARRPDGARRSARPAPPPRPGARRAGARRRARTPSSSAGRSDAASRAGLPSRYAAPLARALSRSVSEVDSRRMGRWRTAHPHSGSAPRFVGHTARSLLAPGSTLTPAFPPVAGPWPCVGVAPR